MSHLSLIPSTKAYLEIRLSSKVIIDNNDKFRTFTPLCKCVIDFELTKYFYCLKNQSVMTD